MKTDELVEEILGAARRVVSVQAEYDSVNHATTNSDYVAKHGEHWQAIRYEIMGRIDERRTYAIWALSRLLSDTAAINEAREIPASRGVHAGGISIHRQGKRCDENEVGRAVEARPKVQFMDAVRSRYNEYPQRKCQE